MLNEKSDKQNIWAVWSGNQGDKWNDFKAGDFVAIMLNPLKYSDEFKLFKEIKKDDVVLAISATGASRFILGIGTVTSIYYKKEIKKDPYIHCYDVQWENREKLEIKESDYPSFLASYEAGKPVRTVTYSDYSKIVDQYPKIDPVEGKILDVIKRTNNIILYGSPGTGKTYAVNKFAKCFLSGQQNKPIENEPNKNIYLDFVTFHQSFTYEDFLEGIKPVMSKTDAGSGEVTYEIKNGVFKDICIRAKNEPSNKYLIIIDEINRANISKVFGELITLIEDDKRLGEKNELQVILPYSKEIFGVPNNLYIIGTMNTSDRSIALLDVALRRRFAFIELNPCPELLKNISVTDFENIKLDSLLTKLNEKICEGLSKDYQIGHSYFMKIKNLEDLRFVWNYQIMPLLQEHFYHHSDKLEKVVGTDLIKNDSDLNDEDFKTALLELSST